MHPRLQNYREKMTMLLESLVVIGYRNTTNISKLQAICQ